MESGFLFTDRHYRMGRIVDHLRKTMLTKKHSVIIESNAEKGRKGYSENTLTHNSADFYRACQVHLVSRETMVAA